VRTHQRRECKYSGLFQHVRHPAFELHPIENLHPRRTGCCRNQRLSPGAKHLQHALPSRQRYTDVRAGPVFCSLGFRRRFPAKHLLRRRPRGLERHRKDPVVWPICIRKRHSAGQLNVAAFIGIESGLGDSFGIVVKGVCG